MEEVRFLCLTLLIELPVALLVTSGKEWRWVLFTGTCVNLVTHPLGWYAVSSGASWMTTEVAITFAEVAVFAVFFPKMRSRAMLAAFVMNAVSALAGKVI